MSHSRRQRQLSIPDARSSSFAGPLLDFTRQAIAAIPLTARRPLRGRASRPYSRAATPQVVLLDPASVRDRSHRGDGVPEHHWVVDILVGSA
jgi:hypothetical protein